MKFGDVCLMVVALCFLQGKAAAADWVFEEVDGVIAAEAEHFSRQTKDSVRKWYLTTPTITPEISPDGDPNHAEGASGGAYLEALPDTRRSHGDKLVKGENFFDAPGQAGVLYYNIYINKPGRYYVWARIFSTNTEDNGMHVGLNGEWPESGRRMQWTKKQQWAWGSKQRTQKNHGGEKHRLYLDINKPGEHTIMFSMREDGTEFDKWMMTTEKLEHVEGFGPEPKLKSGKLPAPVPVKKTTPKKEAARVELGRIPAIEFTNEGGFYKDQGKWLAVHPDKNKSGTASLVFPYRKGVFDVTFEMVGENDGQSTYEVWVEGRLLGSPTCPASQQAFEEGAAFHAGWNAVEVNEGDVIRVKATIASADGKEWSRARWAAIQFLPVDDGAPLVSAKTAPQEAEKKRVVLPPLFGKRQPDGDGSVAVGGELRPWHNVVLTLDGPFAHELDNQPNPFVDRNMNVVFTHESGEPKYTVPGYFAADGNAAETSADCGTKWRAHLSPDKPGVWSYSIEFKGTPYDGKNGRFTVGESDLSGEPRAKGRLHYVGKRYLRFAGSGEWFLKAGADAPETLLGYTDFDNTEAHKPGRAPLKTWSPHKKDWQAGDPSWQGGKGKGLIGAINYLSAKGCNVFSFLTYNAGGDGDNVWPHVSRDDKLHFDCSKLDQWGVVFNHATDKGMYLHFKLQETENDDLNTQTEGREQALDDGDLGVERKAYLREMIARYGHNLALNWNLGEENTQSEKQVDDMARFVRETDPYGHNVVLHTFPEQQEKKYTPFLGKKDRLIGVSIQNSDVADSHRDVLKWVTRSESAGHPWVVAMDEAGNAGAGTPPDPDWPGMEQAVAQSGKLKIPSIDAIRAQVLWGTLMAGGTGVEYYFGYRLPENDLNAEDWRSREKTWDYSRIALDFFRTEKIPFWEMTNANALIGNADNRNKGYCLAQEKSFYLIYLPVVSDAALDLSAAEGAFSVRWFNPREGGALKIGSIKTVQGGGQIRLGMPPSDQQKDWVILVCPEA